MAENGTTFTPVPKQKGDFILAQEWNSAMTELVQLRTELASQTIDTIAGDLKVGGRLGVGAATPQAKLHVTGQGGMNIDLIVSGRMQSNNNAGGLWVASDRFVGGHSNDQIGFWNGNAWRLTVRPDGNIGIGTLTPRAKLDISDGKLQLDGNQQIVFANSDITNNLKIQLWSGFGLGINSGTLFYAANGRHSWRDNNGNGERMALTTAADGGLAVLGTGVSSFAGSVGIGTTNPTAKLEVSGAVRAASFQGDGSALTGIDALSKTAGKLSGADG
ncbi:MAG: hypothetical protein R2911_23545 [Caldilineaceae bacterium]